MNDHRDGEISAPYRALSDDAPPAVIDAAIRAAAHAAPPRAIAGPGRPWLVRRAAPLALAATVLLSVGVVTRIAIEQPDLQPPSEVASAPASAPVPPSAPPPAEARQEATAPTPQAPIARQEKKSRAAAPAGPAPLAETSPAPSSAERERAAEAPARPADKRESAAPSAASTAIADARPALAGNASTTAAPDRADTALGASASENVAQQERKQSRQMQDAPRAAALRTESAPAQPPASAPAPAPLRPPHAPCRLHRRPQPPNRRLRPHSAQTSGSSAFSICVAPAGTPRLTPACCVSCNGIRDSGCHRKPAQGMQNRAW